jgi:segregation and condensation protein B
MSDTPDHAAGAGSPADTGAEAARIPADWLRLAEAAVFAAAGPVAPQALAALLPEGADVAAVLEALRTRYAGRGVELAMVGGGVQFRTAPDLAPALRKVIEVPRRLPRAAMEALAIIAYHQPVTRAEIEEIRGASLSQNSLDALLEAELVAPRGRRETPGRPTLWGTTAAFLTRFGLADLRELPRREELLNEAATLPEEPPTPATAPAEPGDGAAPAAPAEPDDPGAPTEGTG